MSLLVLMESEAKLAHAGDTEDAGGADESYPGHASLHLMTDVRGSLRVENAALMQRVPVPRPVSGRGVLKSLRRWAVSRAEECVDLHGRVGCACEPSAASAVLKFEPGNSLVRGYQPVLLQMKKMRAFVRGCARSRRGPLACAGEEEKMAEMGSDDEDDSDEDEEGDSDSDGDEDEESEEDGGEEGSAAEGGDVAAAEEAKGSDAAEFKSDRQTARTGGGFR